MTACRMCPHFRSEHDETAPGDRFLGRCRVRHYTGYFDVYAVCDCPGYEPVEGEDSN